MNAAGSRRAAPDAVACARWSHVQPSSDADGPPRARVDHYALTVQPASGEAPGGTFARLRERLFAYDVFPGGRCSVRSTRQDASRGATIVQRVQLGLFAIEAAARGFDVWEDALEAGFGYVTCGRHPEWGVETFHVRLEPDGRVRVHIEARSRPGHFLTRLGFSVAAPSRSA